MKPKNLLGIKKCKNILFQLFIESVSYESFLWTNDIRFSQRETANCRKLWKFQFKRMLPSRDIKVSKKREKSDIIYGIWAIFETSISREGNILLSWNFQSSLLTNRLLYEQNLRSKYHQSIWWYIPCLKLKFQ